MTVKCELIINSDVEHLRQIYTGFSLLHQKGFLQLKQTIPNEFLLDKTGPNRWVNYKFFQRKSHSRRKGKSHLRYARLELDR